MHPLNDKSVAKLIIFTAARLEQFANVYVFKPMGLTTTAVKIMGLLHFHGPLTPTDILKLIGGTKSNVTQRLNFLEKSGLVDRAAPKKTSSDRRKKMIKLTAGGIKKLVLASELINKKSLDLEKCFNKKENGQFYEFLIRTNLLVNSVEEEYLKISPKKFRSGDILNEVCGFNSENCEKYFNHKKI